MYGVSINAILNANPGTTQHIKAGAVLNIPQKNKKRNSTTTPDETHKVTNASKETNNAESNDYTFHTIVRGETLFHIAQLHQCSVEDLLRANPGIKPNKLYDGSVIRIPQKANIKINLCLNKYPIQHLFYSMLHIL